MKEKVIFIMAIMGSFSATIILLINHALTILEVDTTGYVEIINVVGLGLAAVILIVAMIFLNKYNVLQNTANKEQRGLITNALDTNAGLMSTLLPKLAETIMTNAEERATQLLQISETKVNDMMTKMLPELAEQTMKVVTQQSQNIVEETTAKANTTMDRMNDLIPTYSKQISDSVAQTVRENNAHYHKMLVELKGLFSNINTPAANSTPITPIIDMTVLRKLEQTIIDKQQLALTQFMEDLMLKLTAAEELKSVEKASIEDIITVEESTTQNEESLEKSDETETT